SAERRAVPQPDDSRRRDRDHARRVRGRDAGRPAPGRPAARELRAPARGEHTTRGGAEPGERRAARVRLAVRRTRALATAGDRPRRATAVTAVLRAAAPEHRREWRYRPRRAPDRSATD